MRQSTCRVCLAPPKAQLPVACDLRFFQKVHKNHPELLKQLFKLADLIV
jgi:hypothetical protein